MLDGSIAFERRTRQPRGMLGTGSSPKLVCASLITPEALSTRRKSAERAEDAAFCGIGFQKFVAD